MLCTVLCHIHCMRLRLKDPSLCQRGREGTVCIHWQIFDIPDRNTYPSDKVDTLLHFHLYRVTLDRGTLRIFLLDNLNNYWQRHRKNCQKTYCKNKTGKQGDIIQLTRYLIRYRLLNCIGPSGSFYNTLWNSRIFCLQSGLQYMDHIYQDRNLGKSQWTRPQ